MQKTWSCSRQAAAGLKGLLHAAIAQGQQHDVAQPTSEFTASKAKSTDCLLIVMPWLDTIAFSSEVELAGALQDSTLYKGFTFQGADPTEHDCGA